MFHKFNRINSQSREKAIYGDADPEVVRQAIKARACRTKEEEEDEIKYQKWLARPQQQTGFFVPAERVLGGYSGRESKHRTSHYGE